MYLKKVLQLLGVAVIIAVCFYLIVIIVGTFTNWLDILDSSLDTNLYATLVGLALATVSLIQGSLSNYDNLLNTANEKVLLARRNIDTGVDTVEAENWLKANPNVTYEEIKKAKFPPDILTLLKRKFELARVFKKIENINNIKQDILNAFIIFIIGLVHSLTLDLLFTANEVFLNKLNSISNIFSISNYPLEAARLFFDLTISFAIISCGIYYLVRSTKSMGIVFDYNNLET